MDNLQSNWDKTSWKNFPVKQQPDWPNQQELAEVIESISVLPPLVFAGEIRTLKKSLAEAAQGKAFLLQAGDCAEEFRHCTAPIIRENLKVILQMAVILTYAGEKPVIKLGRVAGQYAKPRSNPTEIINGKEYPSYRGDMVNRAAVTMEARIPKAGNLLEGYFRSASTLNIARAFTKGGFAALHHIHRWNKEFVKESKQGEKYETLANQIDQALKFMEVIGFDPDNTPELNHVQYYTSHEALILEYEQALTRRDSITGDWYDCSAHMLWIGDRTRQLDGAHVEFFRGVKNPIGIKIGPNHELDTMRKILDVLNPENEWGRITLIARFGADKVGQYLPELIRTIQKDGRKVLWSCDPMHGNTYTSNTKYKTRKFDDILSEIKRFFQVHWSEGTIPGGIHIELTGQNVTECTGGAQEISEDYLNVNYETTCDPRLNAQQSIELAFLIADMLRKQP
ncbi:MAG: 3-deoxy-7-phosphoheptulonate synthase class II [Pseudomonadales bacterium]